MMFSFVLLLALAVVSSVLAKSSGSTTSVCLTPRIVKYVPSTSKNFGVGDCLNFVDKDFASSFAKKGTRMTMYISKNLTTTDHLLGIFQPVDKKGCQGLKLLETTVQKPLDLAPKSSCPAGQMEVNVGVKTSKATKVNTCTRYYAKKSDIADGKNTWESDSGLCYKKCEDRKGFEMTGNGPVCWQKKCPTDMKDVGAMCQKHTYGRGSGNWKKSYCKKHAGKKTGCEKTGLLYYPKCRSGYKNSGCCICEQKCPKGMKNGGADCYKVSYGRGVGKVIPDSATEWGIIVGSVLGAAVATLALAVATGGISLIAEAEIGTTIAAGEGGTAAITIPGGAAAASVTSPAGVTILVSEMDAVTAQAYVMYGEAGMWGALGNLEADAAVASDSTVNLESIGFVCAGCA